MKILINSSLIPTINPRNVTPNCFSISSPTSIRTFNRFHYLSKTLIMKCSLEERETNGGLKDVLSGIVDKRVEELLNKEENRVLLDGLMEASQRVEIAKKELAEIERQELEATQIRNYINQLESRTSEIAECQREILEAKVMVEEAERSLSSKMDGDVSEDGGNALTYKDKERLESIKAASISAVIGTLVGLPIIFSQVASTTELILPVAITFISCALFGVTFRYTIRRDLDDIHLKSGVSAAFAVVKGLAVLGAGPPLELDSASFISHAVNGALYVSEELFIFVFASVSLDFCFKMRLLSPFPIKE